MIELSFNGQKIELAQGSYKESFSNVDKLQQSEGGTTLRSVTRTGIRTLSVSYKCNGTEKAKLEAFSKAQSLNASLFSETTSGYITWKCFMTGFYADLIVESNNDRFYKVGFKLNDLS